MRRKIRIKKRTENTRKECKLFLVICEGRKTERVYFKGFRTRNNGIRIEAPHCSSTDPLNLTRFANKMCAVYDIDLKIGDRIWCVFDVDRNNDEMIKKAYKEAEMNKIDILLSNPCFELWYLLHFEFSTAYLTPGQAARKLDQHIPGYRKNVSYFELLKPHLPEAVEHAQKLNRFHEKNGTPLFTVGSNPSTQAFRLIQKIWPEF
jgi:hypothetical protein